MKDAAPQPIYLKDYTPPAYLVDEVHLTFDLHPTRARVTSRIAFRPNPDTTNRAFFLHGELLDLKWARIDGQDAHPEVTEDGLTAQVPDAPFVWEAAVEISPETNTALEGLYMSRAMYCTQCEAEGFRKITFYPDRPDVMATFTVRIKDSTGLPVLLSNGNDLGRDADGYHVWHDPWPKPSYLFALVAGDLHATSDSFTTASGRKVALNIYVRDGDQHKTAFAMDALKRSMRWDEEVYGREYDLDLFNIVAVDDFNMGAMENKGLNIFNSSAVLASPETATDANFERIEGIIAHEYFHNWTGNRITCRDWFQLCLKEGLTVFRDQQFTADTRDPAVKRIGDVMMLRARQFREDNGPLAHPVRPESFVEINNFYTSTVYEKGAEVIGMLKRLVGDDGYRAALDLYFERHDGDAATIEDWLKVFEDATGRDLGQFKRWYSQAGTPRLSVNETFKDSTYTLHFKQETPPTPGQAEKKPQVIPIAVGLLGQNGDEILPTQVLEMTEAEQSFAFDVAQKPIPSILRGFSAPVILTRETTNAERAFLLAHDTDPFNRWEAGRALTKDVLVAMVTRHAAADPQLLDALRATALDDALDPAFRALVLAMPSQDDMAQTLHDAGFTPDPLAIWRALEALREGLADHLGGEAAALYQSHRKDAPFSPDAKSAGHRALAGSALALLTRLDGGAAARAQLAAADNMTDELAALLSLLAVNAGEDEAQAFRKKWQGDRLVMDKWFGFMAGTATPETGVDRVKTLTEDTDFDWKNPNRFRAVLGGMVANPVVFHDGSGAGYGLLADWLIRLDAVNPQTTARMSTAFETWQRYDADRQALIRAALQRILATPDLSRDMTEMVTRILGA